MKEGLCLYCRKSGHIAHNCPKAVAVKARTASVESKDSADSKKIVCNPQVMSSRAEGCVDLDHVANFVRLNASTLSDPDSLFISLAILNSLSMCTLIDSSSSHYFLDSSFVSNHKITTTTILLIGLCLFDGTCNSTITQIAMLLITFPTGKEFTLTFYVTLLDSSCSAVLGYNWLRQYNPSIDWSIQAISLSVLQSTEVQHRRCPLVKQLCC
jgi:hypothetical protein